MAPTCANPGLLLLIVAEIFMEGFGRRTKTYMLLELINAINYLSELNVRKILER